MTIICCKIDENYATIAADSRSMFGDLGGNHIGESQKIVAYDDKKMVVGGSGPGGRIQAFFHFLKDYELKEELSYATITQMRIDFMGSDLNRGFSDFDVHLIFMTKDKIFFVDGLNFICEKTDFEAIGSGREVAWGALLAGADVYRSVEIVNSVMPACGPPILQYKIDRKTGVIS